MVFCFLFFFFFLSVREKKEGFADGCERATHVGRAGLQRLAVRAHLNGRLNRLVERFEPRQHAQRRAATRGRAGGGVPPRARRLQRALRHRTRRLFGHNATVHTAV